MEYRFYGWQQATVPAVSAEYPGILTPRGLYDALCSVWCEYTCAPRLREECPLDRQKRFQSCLIMLHALNDERLPGAPHRKHLDLHGIVSVSVSLPDLSTGKY